MFITQLVGCFIAKFLDRQQEEKRTARLGSKAAGLGYYWLVLIPPETVFIEGDKIVSQIFIPH